MSEESDLEKTEDPTPHRRDKARKEGQIPRSKELTSLLMLFAGWCLVLSSGDGIARTLAQLLRHGLLFDRWMITDVNIMFRQFDRLMMMAITSLLPFFLGLFFCGIAAPTLLGGLHFSGKSFTVDLKRLSPLAGIKRMVSGQTLSELFKGVIKVTLVGVVCGGFIFINRQNFIQLSNKPLSEALYTSRTIIAHCLMAVILTLIPLVGYDVFYQLMSDLKKLRMTRQEIRDEFKQQEGDPHVKGRIKQLQRSASRKRMMANVPKADVIVNNPTHYSIALSYKEGGMAAPTLLAKGSGEIALRIREQGIQHGIPMLEAPPLARALYRHCEVGDPIPTELYSAVAEVLAWVYRLKHWRSSGGAMPKKPENLPVPTALDFAQEN